MLKDLYDKREDDGIQDCFRSDGYIQGISLGCDDNSRIAMEDIPPFLRTILITDGTVTKSLEAYYWEPVIVDMAYQNVEKTEQPIVWLKAETGEEVLLRDVRLRGKNSGNCYANAFSVIHHQLLPENLRDGLLAGSLGIGMLIRDCGLETYRQILDVGVKKQMLGQVNIDQPTGKHDYVFRTYRIYIAHEPVIIITESFPWRIYC
ncbi:chorismate pyruvate-lyase family protein [Methylosoma difficile]